MQRQLRSGGRQMHFDGLWQGPEAAERCMLTGAARREAAGKLPPTPRRRVASSLPRKCRPEAGEGGG